MAKKGTGKGWHGASGEHKKIGQKGGKTTAARHGKEFYSAIGRKGGKVSSGNFAHDPARAQLMGRKGGKQKGKNKKGLEPKLKIPFINVEL